MEKTSEIPTLDLKDVAKPIIELSKNQPLKKSSLSILSLLKYLSCISSRSTIIQTQSLGDAFAKATLELQEQVQIEVESVAKKVEEVKGETEKAVEKAVLAVVEQAQVLKQAQMKEAEAQETEALNQLDIMKAQSKEDIMDPTTIKILMNVTDGLRVVTEKNEKMDEPHE